MISIIKLFICCTLFCLPLSSYSQNNDERAWNKKKSAICLTYDDGLNVHLDKVIPQLDSMNFKGTFYITGNSQSLDDRMEDWRKAAQKGHELGNHTLFHPCNGGLGREWVKPDYDLSKYSLVRIIDEVKIANTLLKAIDGKTKRSFAYTCGDQQVENVLFMEKLKDELVSARGVRTQMPKIPDIDLYNIGCNMINGQSGDDLIKLAKKNLESKSLLVFLFHGVGGEHNINVSLDAHRELLMFVKENDKDIWVAPFIEISEFIKEFKNKTNIKH